MSKRDRFHEIVDVTTRHTIEFFEVFLRKLRVLADMEPHPQVSAGMHKAADELREFIEVGYAMAPMVKEQKKEQVDEWLKEEAEQAIEQDIKRLKQIN